MISVLIIVVISHMAGMYDFWDADLSINCHFFEKT
jgi:hypothetical protein